ncbi:MAG TPA: hypothetical protein ENN03_07155 [bacterium]|nr:hypothetical protein [bacterium]
MVSRITDKGDYLHLVFDGELNNDNIHDFLNEAATMIRRPGNRVRLLSDFETSIVVGGKVKNAVAEWVKENTPFVKKSAVLGIKGFKYAMGQFVLRTSGRKNIRLFDSEKAALEWLLE